MKVQVLGSGCAKCKKLYESVKKVTGQVRPDITVEYITDFTKIVELGAMSSPVFAINDKVIFAGKIPSEEEIAEALNS